MAGLVVLHVSDQPANIARALSAAELITSREPMRVQVVINGEAITGLSGSEPIGAGEGVSVWACERALKQRGLPPDGLRPGVGTVPSAVIALANAQHEGAAYIRI